VPNESDPRVFFAAERTLLAWLRSGLTVIGLGFVVARFGLFLHVLRRPGADQTPSLPSSLIGVGLVVLGAVMIATAAWQHTRFLRQLTDSQRPARYWLRFAVWVCAALSALGVALAAYLLWSMDM
jgi:putative membrane protein